MVSDNGKIYIMEVFEKDLKKEAENFLNTLTPKDGATVVGLYGDLGAGKTTFTKALAEILGVKEIVTSPTFVLEKIYKLKNQIFSNLIHIDAYRLESGEELKQLQWDTILSDKNNLIVVEWADNVENFLPKNTSRIYFKTDYASQDISRYISYA